MVQGAECYAMKTLRDKALINDCRGLAELASVAEQLGKEYSSFLDEHYGYFDAYCRSYAENPNKTLLLRIAIEPSGPTKEIFWLAWCRLTGKDYDPNETMNWDPGDFV